MKFEPLHESGTRTPIARLFGLVLLVLSFAPAVAGKSIDLVLDVPVGRGFRYRIAQDAEGTFNGIPFSTMLSAELEVTRVASEGENLHFQVVFAKTEASRRLGSDTEPQDLGLDGMKADVEVTAHGRLVKLDPPTGATADQRSLLTRLADAVFVELPSESVGPDDTWQLDLSKREEGLTATGDYVLDSVDTKNGVQVAKISGQMKMHAAQPEANGKGHAQAEVAVVGGYLLSSKGSVDVEPKEGPTVTQSYEIHLLP